MRYHSGVRRVLVLVAIAGCHLADSPETNCQPGYHPANGACAQDPITASDIVINAGSPCGVDPNPFHIASGTAFQFVNHDQVDHGVIGADGQVWVSNVAKGQTSDYFKIDKKGSWDYTVSGCKSATVIVE